MDIKAVSMNTRVTLLALIILFCLTAYPLTSVLSAQEQNPLVSKQEAMNPPTEDLLAIVRDKKMQQGAPEQVARAIKRLGERKSTTAIDDLVKLLNFKLPDASEKFGHVSGSATREPYPAIVALFEIGKATLPALIGAIEREESGSTTSDNACRTVFFIFGDELPKGVEYLKEAAAKADSAEGRERVLKAADNMKKYIR